MTTPAARPRIPTTSDTRPLGSVLRRAFLRCLIRRVSSPIAVPMVTVPFLYACAHRSKAAPHHACAAYNPIADPRHRATRYRPTTFIRTEPTLELTRSFVQCG
jgi:hypothetical protein